MTERIIFIWAVPSPQPEVTVNRIAKWDEKTWIALGSGLNGSFSSIAVNKSGNLLYAGGSFDTAGGIPSSNIAQYVLPTTYTISGKVSDSQGTPISDVTLTFGNNGGVATTDTSGNYSKALNPGWSGTVTFKE